MKETRRAPQLAQPNAPQPSKDSKLVLRVGSLVLGAWVLPSKNLEKHRKTFQNTLQGRFSEAKGTQTNLVWLDDNTAPEALPSGSIIPSP